MVKHLPLARRFCAGCGSEILWPITPNGRRATKLRCGGCGCDLYRNPDVNVLCLAYRTDNSDVHLSGAPLADVETVQDAAQRALSGHRTSDEQTGASLTLFAVIDDLDDDRMHVVFRVPIADSCADSLQDIRIVSWIHPLVSALRLELAAGQSRVHTGTVLDGQLQLIQ